MKLYFRRATGENVLIGNPTNKAELWKMVDDDLKERAQSGFKSYYKRIWLDGGNVWIDVGSHVEFYIAKDVDFKTLKLLGFRIQKGE